MRLAIEAGERVRDERLRRGWTLRLVAERAGAAVGVVHAIEAGRPASLESYARVAVALDLRPSLQLTDQRRRAMTAAITASGGADFVHAAMAEVEARALVRPERSIAVDEPYQHYQFAGRADLLAWDSEHLLHIENRTRFPNFQEAAGSYNAKRRYLPGVMAERLGIGPAGWRSVAHVMACLWSAEVLRALRLRRASFAALCPDPPDQLMAWLRGDPVATDVSSTLVLLDPCVEPGSRRRTIVAVTDLARRTARHRGYAEAAEALRRRR